jgi:hypothetical protein
MKPSDVYMADHFNELMKALSNLVDIWLPVKSLITTEEQMPFEGFSFYTEACSQYDYIQCVKFHMPEIYAKMEALYPAMEDIAKKWNQWDEVQMRSLALKAQRIANGPPDITDIINQIKKRRHEQDDKEI